MLLGNAGGALKAGSFADLKGGSSKTLMQTVLQLCGVPAGAAAHFGGQSYAELRV
jgi:hypothetical protein